MRNRNVLFAIILTLAFVALAVGGYFYINSDLNKQEKLNQICQEIKGTWKYGSCEIRNE